MIFLCVVGGGSQQIGSSPRMVKKLRNVRKKLRNGDGPLRDGITSWTFFQHLLSHIIEEDDDRNRHTLFDFGCSSGDLMYNYLNKYVNGRAFGVECVFGRVVKAEALLKEFVGRFGVLMFEFGDDSEFNVEGELWMKSKLEESTIVYICSTVYDETQVLYAVRLFSLYCKVGAFLLLYRGVVDRSVTNLVLREKICIRGFNIGNWTHGPGKDSAVFLYVKI